MSLSLACDPLDKEGGQGTTNLKSSCCLSKDRSVEVWRPKKKRKSMSKAQLVSPSPKAKGRHRNVNGPSRTTDGTQVEDDETWRDHGRLFRSKILTDDEASGNMFALSDSCAIERYYRVADRVFEHFISINIADKMKRNEMIDSYIISNRLFKFLADILPNHKMYWDADPGLEELRRKSESQLKALLEFIDELELMIDEMEYNRYIMNDLAREIDADKAEKSTNLSRSMQTSSVPPPSPSNEEKWLDSLPDMSFDDFQDFENRGVVQEASGRVSAERQRNEEQMSWNADFSQFDQKINGENFASSTTVDDSKPLPKIKPPLSYSRSVWTHAQVQRAAKSSSPSFNDDESDVFEFIEDSVSEQESEPVKTRIEERFERASRTASSRYENSIVAETNSNRRLLLEQFRGCVKFLLD